MTTTSGSTHATSLPSVIYHPNSYNSLSAILEAVQEVLRGCQDVIDAAVEGRRQSESARNQAAEIQIETHKIHRDVLNSLNEARWHHSEARRLIRGTKMEVEAAITQHLRLVRAASHSINIQSRGDHLAEESNHPLILCHCNKNLPNIEQMVYRSPKSSMSSNYKDDIEKSLYGSLASSTDHLLSGRNSPQQYLLKPMLNRPDDCQTDESNGLETSNETLTISTSEEMELGIKAIQTEISDETLQKSPAQKSNRKLSRGVFLRYWAFWKRRRIAKGEGKGTIDQCSLEWKKMTKAEQLRFDRKTFGTS